MDKSMEALMQQMAADNPKLQTLLTLMQQQQTDNDSNTQPSDNEELVYYESGKIKKQNRLIKRLHTELSIAENLIEHLAAGLGACPTCWGHDDQCEECDGKGKPGAFKIDKRSFQTYVLPVIRKNPNLITLKRKPNT